MLQDVVGHALLLGVVWYGGLGFPGLMLVLALESFVIHLLSIAVYRERGLLRHLRDLLVSIGLLGALLGFLGAVYLIALDQVEGYDGSLDWRDLLRFDPDALAWAAAWACGHLALMLVASLLATRPREAWSRLSLMQSGVSYVLQFLLLLAVPFLGAFAVGVARSVDPEVEPGLAIAAGAVALRLLVALGFGLLPDSAVRDMADDPYGEGRQSRSRPSAT
jgi:hypothetical protein